MDKEFLSIFVCVAVLGAVMGKWIGGTWDAAVGGALAAPIFLFGLIGAGMGIQEWLDDGDDDSFRKMIADVLPWALVALMGVAWMASAGTLHS